MGVLHTRSEYRIRHFSHGDLWFLARFRARTEIRVFGKSRYSFVFEIIISSRLGSKISACVLLRIDMLFCNVKKWRISLCIYQDIINGIIITYLLFRFNQIFAIVRNKILSGEDFVINQIFAVFRKKKIF